MNLTTRFYHHGPTAPDIATLTGHSGSSYIDCPNPECVELREPYDEWCRKEVEEKGGGPLTTMHLLRVIAQMKEDPPHPLRAGPTPDE